jgi:succinylglutamate desuccinylase
VKVTIENVALEMEFNKVKQERDEAAQKVERMQQNSRRYIKNSQNIKERRRPLVKYQVMKISESI